MVFGVKNNDAKPIHCTRYSRDDSRMTDLCDYLARNYDAEIINTKFSGDEIGQSLKIL